MKDSMIMIIKIKGRGRGGEGRGGREERRREEGGEKNVLIIKIGINEAGMIIWG